MTHLDVFCYSHCDIDTYTHTYIDITITITIPEGKYDFLFFLIKGRRRDIAAK